MASLSDQLKYHSKASPSANTNTNKHTNNGNRSCGNSTTPGPTVSAPTAPSAPFFLTRRNFVLDSFPILDRDRSLFVFFDRAAVTSNKTAEVQFGNMRREYRMLLKIVAYLAHCYDATVRLLYMEPSLPGTTRLPPSLRCALTCNFCLITTIPNAPDSLSSMIDAVKRLIAVDLNLLTTVSAFVMRNDPEKTASVLSLYDWSLWKYAPEALDGSAPRCLRTSLDKPLPSGDTTFTKNALTAMVVHYFGGDPDDDVEDAGDTDSIIEFLLHNLTVPDKHPIYRAFKETTPNASTLKLIDELSSMAYCAAASVEDTLLFQYSIEHLLNKDDLNLFEETPLLRYPSSNNTRMEIDLKSHIEAIVSATENGTARVMSDQTHVDDYAIVWPHLYAYKRAADEAIGDTALEKLRLKCNLFESVVLRNTSRIVTQPSIWIYERACQLTTNGIRDLSYSPQSRQLRSTHISCAAKYGDCTFLTETFVDALGLGRAAQAFLTLIHILHTTAPKWKAPKIMLVNHTRSGTGKTHTMNALRVLLSRVQGLFSAYSTMTDTVWKYNEMNISKVVVFDDVGLSNNQQRNSRREDSLLAAQFKSLLDTGYTNNQVTERESRTNAFRVTNYVMVFNVACIWNSNTIETFSDAFLDRCVVLGAEPILTGFKPKPAIHVAKMIRELTLCERFELTFVRQHILQTLLFTACLQDACPSETAVTFVTATLDRLREHFPTINASDSIFRSHFKTMDLVMAETIRNAIAAVLDWWVPPWTIPPEVLLNESVGNYVARLNEARVNALSRIGLAELCVEILAQIKIFFPSSAIEIISLTFNQTTKGVFIIAYELINRALHYDVSGTFTRTDTPCGPMITINHANVICPEIVTTEKSLLAQAQNVYVKNGTSTVRLVDEITSSTVRFNGFFLFELLKMYGRTHYTTIYDTYREVFSNELDSRLAEKYYQPLDSIRCTPSVHHKNFFSLYSRVCTARNPHIPEVLTTINEQCLINPTLMGIATSLYVEHVLHKRTSRDVLDMILGKHANMAYYRTYTHEIFASSLDTTQLLSAEHDYICSNVKWFTRDYVERELLTSFAHSPCGILPSGTDVPFYCRNEEDKAVPTCSWEYKEAHEIYVKYLSPGAAGTLDDVARTTSRYLCHAQDQDASVNNDAHVQTIINDLPRTILEATNVLKTRYGNRHGDKKVRKRLTTAATPATPIPLKKVLTTAGMLLWDQMQKATGK